MAVYEVLNDANEVLNTIAADEQFMAANHDNYRLVPAPDTSETDGRAWRDSELARTDIIAQTPDWIRLQLNNDISALSRSPTGFQ